MNYFLFSQNVLKKESKLYIIQYDMGIRSQPLISQRPEVRHDDNESRKSVCERSYEA